MGVGVDLEKKLAPSRAQADHVHQLESVIAQRQDATGSTGEPRVPHAQVLSGGLNTMAPLSWEESVPAAYVDWTHGPSFVEYPANPAQIARTKERVRQTLSSGPSATDVPTAAELALHRQSIPMRSSPSLPP